MRRICPGVVRVVRGRPAHHRGAALQRRDHVPVGLRCVGPAFLREDAQLQVDAPRVVGRELLQGFEPAQPDVGVDLDVGTHVGDAVEDAPLQGFGGPRIDVLHREPRLDCGHALHVVAGPARGRRAPVDDAGLVEVDVRLDQTGRDEASIKVEAVGAGRDLRRDGDDPPAGNPDVHRRRIHLGSRDPGTSKKKIQSHEKPRRTTRSVRATIVASSCLEAPHAL